MNPILPSVVVMAGTSIIRRVREQKNYEGTTTQIVLYAYLLYMALLLLNMVAPQVARTLAYLGIVGAFVVNGPAVFGYLGDLGKDQKGKQLQKAQKEPGKMLQGPIPHDS